MADIVSRLKIFAQFSKFSRRKGVTKVKTQLETENRLSLLWLLGIGALNEEQNNL